MKQIQTLFTGQEECKEWQMSTVVTSGGQALWWPMVVEHWGELNKALL